MSNVNKSYIDKLLDGATVEWKSLWQVTTWDKKFNAVDSFKQPKIIRYNYLLANEIKPLAVKNGTVKLLTTNVSDFWTTEELAGSIISDGEVIAIPWGGNVIVQYYKGKFLTCDNRLATSNDTEFLDNKYLYYFLLNNIGLLSSFYRGSGIKHPSMAAVLDMRIPIPPLHVQAEIVRILDTFTELTTELTTELATRKKQYNYYRDKLLTFDDSVEWKTLGEVAKVGVGSKPSEISEQVLQYEYINAGTTNSGFVPQFNDDGGTVTTPSRGQGGIGHVGYMNNPFWLGPLCYGIKSTDKSIITKYLFYYLQNNNKVILALKKEGGVPAVNRADLIKIEVPIPPLAEQERIVAILDKFDTLTNSISEGLPREIELRKQQYEYYRNMLLTFPKNDE